MKRKILILLCAVCLVLSFSVTAFASAEKFPNVPTDCTNFVVYETNGTYNAMAFNTYGQSPGKKEGAYDVYPYEWYTFNDGAWVLTNSQETGLQWFTVDGVGRNVVYDTTGVYGIPNIIEFIKPIGFNDFTAYYDGLKGQITVGNVVGVLVVGVGAVVGLVFMYWGIRKGVKALMSAFRKGKISL